MFHITGLFAAFVGVVPRRSTCYHTIVGSSLNRTIGFAACQELQAEWTFTDSPAVPEADYLAVVPNSVEVAQIRIDS